MNLNFQGKFDLFYHSCIGLTFIKSNTIVNMHSEALIMDTAVLCYMWCGANTRHGGSANVLLPKAPFTLLRFHIKKEQILSVLALRSHGSTVKTELFENANENA